MRSCVVGSYEGIFLDKVGLPGVVAVHGRLRSRWLDIHLRGLPLGGGHLWAAMSSPHFRVARRVICIGGNRPRQAGCAVSSRVGRSLWGRLACSWGCVPGVASQWLRALGGVSQAVRWRCGGR